MSTSKKFIYGFLFLEVQLILIALFFLIPKVIEIDEKVERTNRFVFNALQDQRSVALQKPKSTDIVLGDKNAPATMVMYTKFDCSACQDFHETTFGQLYNEYVVKGKLKIVVRYLTPKGNEDSFFAAKSAHYAYQQNEFSAFNKKMFVENKAVNKSTTETMIYSILPDTAAFRSFIEDENTTATIFDIAKEARKSGITKTPTFVINGQKLAGNRRYEKLEKLIQESF